MARSDKPPQCHSKRGPSKMPRDSEPTAAAAANSPTNDTVVSREPDTEHLRAELGAARQELETLYAALDSVHSGLLILDDQLHARYSNPVLHDMFKTLDPAEIRNERPFYGDMLRAAANVSAV